MKVIQLIFVSILVSLPTFAHQKSNHIGDCLLESTSDHDNNSGNFNIKFICYNSAFDKNILSNSTTAQCRNSESFKKNKVEKAEFLICEMDTLPIGFFDTYSQIKVLDVSHMKLEELSTEMHSVTESLEELNASFNNLTGVPSFPTSNNLTNLDLSNNYYIKVLNSSSLDNLINLIFLNLSKCALSELPEDMFIYQENLQIVDLSQNALKSIDMKIFLPSFFTLHAIYLDENEITELLGELPRILFFKLEILSLGNSQIDCDNLLAFVNSNDLSAIRFLDGTYNGIENLIDSGYFVCKIEINTTPSNDDTTTIEYYNY